MIKVACSCVRNQCYCLELHHPAGLVGLCKLLVQWEVETMARHKYVAIVMDHCALAFNHHVVQPCNVHPMSQPRTSFPRKSTILMLAATATTVNTASSCRYRLQLNLRMAAPIKPHFGTRVALRQLYLLAVHGSTPF